MNRQQITLIFMLVISLILSGCGAGQSTPAANASSAKIANPASENCIQKGGTLTIEKRGDGGEFGVCWFEDALQCEEWALMNGDCPVGGLKVTGYGPQGRYCAITGGKYTVTNNDITNEQGVCTLKNGVQCDGADYWQGLCGNTSSAAPASTASAETMDDIYTASITWMDNLKTCTPYTRSYLNPLFAVQQTDTIKGMEGDVCVVTQETAGKYIFECRYTADGIKTMTQDRFYQDAKNKIASASGNDVSDVMGQQCKVTMLSTPTAP
jgi:hypothetical protein